MALFLKTRNIILSGSLILTRNSASLFVIILCHSATLACSSERPTRLRGSPQINAQDSTGTPSDASPATATAVDENSMKSEISDLSAISEHSEMSPLTAREKEKSDLTAPTGTALSLGAQLEAAIQKLKESELKLATKKEQFSVVSRINHEFCKLYLNQKSQCLALKKLSEQSLLDETTCISKSQQIAVAQEPLTVLLSLNGAKSDIHYKLIANNQFESSPFALGKETELSWKGPSHLTSPALHEITRLSLVTMNGITPAFSQQDLNLMKFYLRTDSQKILEPNDLAIWKAGETSTRISTLPLLALLQAPECNITEKELTDIAGSVRSSSSQLTLGESL